jgi:hypothetical protein
MNEQIQEYLLGKQRIAPTASEAEWKEATFALVKQDLQALTASLPRILPALAEREADTVLSALVESENPDVASILITLDNRLVNKTLRKSARRALHLLRTRGVHVDPSAVTAAHAPPVQAQEEWRAWFTTPDNFAAQSWILEHRGRHRTDLYDFFIAEGIVKELFYLDAATSRDREQTLDIFRKERDGIEPPMLLEEIDPAHARWRVLQAAEYTRKIGKPLPKTLAYVRKNLHPPEGAERHPVWLFFNSFDLRAEMQGYDPKLEEELFHQKYRFWAHNVRIVDSEFLESYLQAANARIQLPPSVKDQQEAERFQVFAERHFNEDWLEFWRWALQDYAYAWYKRGWRNEAALALYWSLNMDHLDIDKNRFLWVFIRNSLLFSFLIVTGIPEESDEDEKMEAEGSSLC